MMTGRVWLIMGSVMIAAAVGCAEPGVTSCSPAPMVLTPGSGQTQTALAGSSGSSNGQAGSAPPAGPCPANYMCTDLSSFGASAVDQDGKPITFSCGMGGPVDCDDANPMSSCAPLLNPVCAHIKVAGMELVSCAQRCTP